MPRRFANVLAHLDLEWRVHSSNTNNCHATLDDRQKSEYLMLEYADAITLLTRIEEEAAAAAAAAAKAAGKTTP